MTKSFVAESACCDANPSGEAGGRLGEKVLIGLLLGVTSSAENDRVQKEPENP